ncbi:MAG TPA: GAF domain-containing protein [Gemmatimonadaceae bacterium]|nr:GAF domain-containing protein [Gemmatimonadaceae bacterium]
MIAGEEGTVGADESGRAAMLRLTSRIAGAQSQKDIFTSLAFGMMDRCFGFTGVDVRLAGDERSAVTAGDLSDGAVRLVTPFAADGGVTGTITVERTAGASFGEVDRELLGAAASHVAVAVTRSGFLDAERRRAQEQQALLDTLADLSGHLELSQLLQAVLQRAITLLGVTGGELAILDAQTKEMVMVASLNLGADSTGLRMRLGEGAMGLVGQTHEPLIIPDYQAWTGKSGKYEQSSVYAVMVAPLLIGKRLVGAIASVHSDPARKFGPEDLRLLEMFAPQAAIAIENARLFTEARRRSEEQTALLETLSALSGELELAKVLDAVLNRAVSLLGVTGGELAIVEEDSASLVIVASHNLGSDSLGTRMKTGEGAMGRVAKTREPLVIPHYQEWAGRSQKYANATFQSVLAAPLLIGTRLVGVIAAVHSDPRHAFGEEGLRLINLFASQAAVAIENARLFTSERKRAEEQQALLDTLSDLSGELELSKVLNAVLNRAIKLLGVTGGELATYDQRRKELRIAASLNMGVDSAGTRMRLGEGAMGYVAQTREPFTIPDYQAWSGRSAKYEQATVHSVMAVPLLIGNRLVGAIAIVHSDPARTLGDEDLRLLQLFAPQAGIAIENARLYEAAQQQFEALVLNNPVAIANVDLDFNIASANPAFEELFGYAQEEVIGKNLDELVTTPELRAEATEHTAIGKAGKVSRGMGSRRRKDGTLIDVEHFTIPVIVAGEKVGIMALYHDVGDLLDARRAAENASKTKSQFLANMSHELRTPLNAIIGYSEMLQEQVEEDGSAEYVPDLLKIRSAGRHLLSLINDVLDLSKIEAGKMELFLEEFSVPEMARDVTTTVQPLIEKNGNRLIAETAAGVGTARADVTKMRQVLFNLLSNASKFTNKGEIRLSIRIDGTEIVYEVRDSGIGMTPEQSGKLFEAFAQADSSTSKHFGGTGLGLALSRQFCRLMGGDITLTSARGEGSTFTVRIPVQVKAVADSEPFPAMSPIDTENATGGLILVIDDDPAARELVQRHLARAGYRTHGAAGGASGLQLARDLKPAAITLDVLMPEMDGWQVLSALKADPAVAGIPVIMSTVLDEKPLSLALGASDYVTKPVDRERLVSVMRRFAGSPDSSVLIVEDDDDARQMMKRMLEKEGWTAVEAENGRVALECVAVRKPSVILLDLMMPEMDGFAFLAALRESSNGRSIPVIVVSALELTDEHRRRLNGGVHQILRKGSYSPEVLLDELRGVIGPPRPQIAS